jgi:hypothetical protein
MNKEAVVFCRNQKVWSVILFSSQMAQMAQNAIDSGGGLLSTAGQLDWVSLIRMTFRISSTVADRLLFRAGVNLETVQAGRAICSTFRFCPEGQDLLRKSLVKLEGVTSYNKFLHFLFDSKPILTELCETEQGAALVAISSALALQYEIPHCAQIIRQLCLLRGASNADLPTIEQWQKLISLCHKSLAPSEFPILLDGLRRAFDPEAFKIREPTDVANIAEALALFGDVTTGKGGVQSVRIAGGIECGLLAAIAQCILGLRIEIFDEVGVQIYHKISWRSGESQVKFYREHRQTQVGRLSIQQAFRIPNGRELLQENSMSSKILLMPSLWRNVLSDSFPEARIFLQTSQYKRQLKELLHALAYQSHAYYSSTKVPGINLESVWWLEWKGQGYLFHPSKTGSDLLRFISRNFEELAFVGETIDPPIENSGKQPYDLDDCINTLTLSCKCSQCWKSSNKPPDLMRICTVRLAMTICRLVLILAPVNVISYIPPSVSAIRQLYDSTRRDIMGHSSRTIPFSGLRLIHYMFTGRMGEEDRSGLMSAVCGDRVCVFLSFLRDINLSPLDATRVEVILGCIKQQDAKYNYVVDIPMSMGAPILQENELDSKSATLAVPSQVDLVVEETQDPKTIAVSYRIRIHEQEPVLLPTAVVQDALQNCIRKCREHLPECIQTSYIEAKNNLWRYTEQASEFDVLLHQPYNAHNDDNDDSRHHNIWSILKWSAWEPPKSQQCLSIIVFSPFSPSLYWILADIYSNKSDLPHYQRRESVLVGEVANCPACVVHPVAAAWAKATAGSNTKFDGIVPFDSNVKDGTLLTKWKYGDPNSRKFLYIPEKLDAVAKSSSNNPFSQGWKLFGGRKQSQ